MEKKFQEFIKNYEDKIIPLRKSVCLAYFEASVTGKPELYKKAADYEIQLSKIFSNKNDFAFIKAVKDGGEIKEALLKRQLDILYFSYLGYQVDETRLETIIKKETEVAQKYSTFRAEYKGKKITDNEINKILRESTNSADLEEVWRAHKKIGNIVAAEVKELVGLRNEIAGSLGFKNYYEMQLLLSEQEPLEIERLFDELDTLTGDIFIKEKKEIDRFLSVKHGVPEQELKPWHYGDRYFQEAPEIFKLDLSKYFKTADPVKITIEFFEGLGLPIKDMVLKSDLYEKPGKNQHAFCIDIDKEGDIRVLCNVKPDFYWMNTLMHEYGHAVYDKNIAGELPYILRSPAHTFVTEAVAMFFGRLASNPKWLKEVMKISEEEEKRIKPACFNHLKLNQLVFCRWVQVMFRFEKALYEDPKQDLNGLWWKLVEKYQLIKKPGGRNEPDWASKIHIATSPCYYHNYQLGELFASQILHYVTGNNNFGEKSFCGDTRLGEYLKENIFKPGAGYNWSELAEKATKEKLSPKYYAKQFVDK